MEWTWTTGSLVALVSLIVAVIAYTAVVTRFVSQVAQHARDTRNSLEKFEGRVDDHLERIYVKLDQLVTSQKEVAELRGTVEGLRDRLRRVEGAQDARNDR